VHATSKIITSTSEDLSFATAWPPQRSLDFSSWYEGKEPNTSGELRPTGTEPGIAKKPVLWAVSSTGMLGAARGQHLALAPTSCPLALRPARSLRPRDPHSQCPPCPRMHQRGAVGCRVVPELTTPPYTSPPEIRPLNDPQRFNGYYDEASLKSSGL
jgi:hypothetical protein